MPYATRPGEPKPLGATVNDAGVNFSIFSQHATDVDLLLFADPTHVEPAQVVRFAARTLYFWHVQVDGLPKNTSYAFRFHGPGSDADTRRFGHRFNANKVLIDPYGRANLRKLWVASSASDTSDNVATSMRSLVTDDRDYDWEGDAAPNIPLSDSVLYELHVRGFTRCPSSGVKWPGTFAGLIECGRGRDGPHLAAWTAPRTDPSGRVYRTGLLPWVLTSKRASGQGWRMRGFGSHCSDS